MACTPNMDGSALHGCAKFCDSKFDDVHCSFCACADCSFCSSRVSWTRLGVPCSSHQAADITENACQEWCAQPKHCAFCKCSACHFCDVASPLSPPPSVSELPPSPPPLEGTSALASAASKTNACSEQRCHARCNPSKGPDCDSCGCQGTWSMLEEPRQRRH